MTFFDENMIFWNIISLDGKSNNAVVSYGLFNDLLPTEIRRKR